MWDLREAPRGEQRKQADRLKKRGEVGDFFVRASETRPGCLGLIVKIAKKKTQAYLIEQTSDWEHFQLQGNRRLFASLSALLRYFATTPDTPLPVMLSLDLLQLGSVEHTPEPSLAPDGPADPRLRQPQHANPDAALWPTHHGAYPPPSFHMYGYGGPASGSMAYPNPAFPTFLNTSLGANVPPPTPALDLSSLENDSSPAAQEALQAHHMLMEKQALAAKARVEALEAAIADARAGGDVGELMRSMQALGVGIPAGDSISAIIAPLDNSVSSRTSPAPEAERPQATKFDAKRNKSKAKQALRDHPELQAEIQQLLRKRLDLERQAADMADRNLRHEQEIHKRRQSRKHKPSKQAASALQQERDELKAERERFERELLEHRIAFQQEQMEHQQRMHDQERQLREEERQRLTELLEHEKQLRAGRKQILGIAEDTDNADVAEVERLEHLKAEAARRNAELEQARQDQQGERQRQRQEVERLEAEKQATLDRLQRLMQEQRDREESERQRQRALEERMVALEENARRDRQRMAEEKEALERRLAEAESAKRAEAERLAQEEEVRRLKLQQEKQQLEQQLQESQRREREVAERRAQEEAARLAAVAREKEKLERELEAARRREAEEAERWAREEERRLDDLAKSLQQQLDAARMRTRPGTSGIALTTSASARSGAHVAVAPSTPLATTAAAARRSAANGARADPSLSAAPPSVFEQSRREAQQRQQQNLSAEYDSNDSCTYLGNCTCPKCR